MLKRSELCLLKTHAAIVVEKATIVDLSTSGGVRETSDSTSR